MEQKTMTARASHLQSLSRWTFVFALLIAGLLALASPQPAQAQGPDDNAPPVFLPLIANEGDQAAGEDAPFAPEPDFDPEFVDPAAPQPAQAQGPDDNAPPAVFLPLIANEGDQNAGEDAPLPMVDENAPFAPDPDFAPADMGPENIDPEMVAPENLPEASASLLATDADLAETIQVQGSDILLGWTVPAGVQSIEIHHSNAPFFTPDASTLLATLPPETTSYLHAGAAGAPATQHYYVIRMAPAAGPPLDSPQLGAIAYALNNEGGKYSLIALPLQNDAITDALSLAAYIGEGHVASLLKWNPASDAFRFFAPTGGGGFVGDNFSLTTGETVFVSLNAGGPAQVTFTGKAVPIQQALTPGTFNFLSLPLQLAHLNDAQAAAADITHVSSLMAWNEPTQAFRLFIPPDVGDNFALTPGAPFIANLDADAPDAWPPTVEHCGTISADETWSANAIHRVTCDMTVDTGVTLTVDSGAIVKFENSRALSVNGDLVASGTAAKPVYFTSIKDDSVGGDTNNDGDSTSPAPGDWGYIQVQSGGLLDSTHAIFQYAAGYTTDGAHPTIYLLEGSHANIQNSTIRYGKTGIHLYTPDGGQAISLTVNSSIIADNMEYGIHSHYASGSYDVSIANSVVNNNGSGGITLSNTNAILTNSQISGNQGNGVSFYKSVLTLTDNEIRSNAGYAIHWSSPSIAAPQMNGNTIADNTWNGLGLSGSVSSDLTLPAHPTVPYVIERFYLFVKSNATLSIDPGAIVKFEGHILVNGDLVASGTAAKPVYFTSIKDDSVGGDTNNDGDSTSPAPGDWGYIQVQSGGLLDSTHAFFQYGSAWNAGTDGLYLYPTIYLLEGSHANIQNSTIRYGKTGIYSSGGALNVRTSNIYENSASGIYNGNPSVIIVAENNWWGSSSGPAPYGSGDSINYRTCRDPDTNEYYICEYYVDADPWLGKNAFVATQLGASGPNTRYQVYEGDPVNTANGNHAYSHTDISIPTRGLPLAFTRAYNSLAPEPGPLGVGWTHTWNVTLDEQTDGSVLVTFGDGHGEQWTWTGSDYEGGPGIFGILVKNGDGSFDLTQKDRTRYHFNAGGGLAYVEDSNANRTSLAYDGQARLITVTGPAGRSLTLVYASPVSPMLVSQVTDNIGRTVSFAYDADANLTAVTDVMGQTTALTYDANHRLLTLTDANGHGVVTNVYDADGRVVEQTNAAGDVWTYAYNLLSRESRVTDPRGFTTIYTYDSEARLVTATDALNQSESYAYDADNNRVEWVNKRGFTTGYAYDARGNTTVVTDTLGFVSTFAYDARNNLLSETDPLGRTTTYAYDAHSNLLSTTDALGNATNFTYDANGLLTTSTDPLGRTTSFAYDAYGYPVNVTAPLGAVTTATYDAAGRKLSETDPLGRTTAFAYDAANRLTAVTDPLGGVTAYAYDAVGNRTAITDPLGNVTAFAYDAKDRLVSTTDPLGNATAFAYDSVDNRISMTDPTGVVTSSTYDALNRLVSVTDPLGNVTTYAYDAVGNRTRMTDANGHATNYAYDALNRLTSVTDAAGGTVAYAYDAVGNRTQMTDANGHITAYAYDALDRLISVTDALGNVTTYVYDAAGNRTARTKPDGTVINYSYDALDRLTGVGYGSGSITFAYDAVGNRTQMSDPAGVTTYAYDALDRLTQVDGPNGTLSYAYDANGNRTAIVYPGGQTVTYAYDAASRLVSVTDWASRTTTYAYDAAGRPTAMAYPNGVDAAYAYDGAGRLLSLVHTAPDSSVIASANYTLDPVGNRLSMTDLDGVSAYTYDSLNRLTRVVYPDGEQVDYVYDSMGNRTSMTSSVHGTTTYAYDAADRLLSVTDPGGTTALTWDANGNMTGKGGDAYAFDALDRLVQVADGTNTVSFAYDGDGVRLSKTVNGTTTSYLQDVAAPLPVVLVEGINGQENRYVYGNDLIAILDSVDVPAYYHVDGLGSTRALSDGGAHRTDYYSYDVFGATRAHVGSSVQDFTFTGEQADPTTGLFFLRARYYDPIAGRFVSRDAFPALAQKIQSLNRYAYVENNPTGFRDPSGNAWYDMLNANKNGINRFVGKHIAPRTPVVSDLIDMAEAGEQYSTNRRYTLDNIDTITEEEYDARMQASMQGMEGMLSSASKAATSAPCTSLNPSCGLTSFAPKPLGDIYNLMKNPFAWLLGKGKDVVVDPIYDIPAHSIEYQFRDYQTDGSVLGASMGGTPNRSK